MRRRRSLMGWVRHHVYKMGFRPRWGSILYSPTLELNYVSQEALSKFFEEMEED